MRFLIAYDIADDKRLRKVAKYFERYAQRVQRSVFVFSESPDQMDQVMRGSLTEIDPHEDAVQSWPIASTTTVGRIDQGRGFDPHALCLIVCAEEVIFVGGKHAWIPELVEAVRANGRRITADSKCQLPHRASDRTGHVRLANERLAFDAGWKAKSLRDKSFLTSTISSTCAVMDVCKSPSKRCTGYWSAKSTSR